MYLKINYKTIINILGTILLIEAGFMLLALPFSFYYKSNDHNPIIYSALITASFGGLLKLLTFGSNFNMLGRRDSYIIVTTTWLIMSFFGTLPFILSGAIPNFTNAFFETMSGFSTTGASILNDIESVPKGILFWRSLTHWIGGMGIVVFVVAILPFLKIGGMQLFAAEMSGPTKDKIHPRITETAKRLWGIYMLFTFLETFFLMLGGMNLYDALCHSFGTIATGGFSTKNASIAAYSPYIQYVITFFMLLSGINFTLHYYGFKGKFYKYWKSDEAKFFLSIIFICIIITTAILFLTNNYDLEKSFRCASFQIISIITTTGFVTDDFVLWSPFLNFLIILLGIIGGCAGSTAGGLKVMRLLTLFKNTRKEFKHLIHPNAVLPVKINYQIISPDIIYNILAFSIIYFTSLIGGVLALSLCGIDIMSALGGAVATLGCVGPSIGTGAFGNYSEWNEVAKWVLSALMLIGRLELFSVFILFAPSFWRH